MELENGKYRAKAVPGQWGVGVAGTGTPQVGVMFELLDRQGETISWYGFLTDKSIEITVRGLRACGWEGVELSDLSGLDKNEVVLVIENETYEGKTIPKVRFVNSSGGLTMNNVLEGNELQAFSAQMRAKIIGLELGSAKKRLASQQQRRSEPPPPSDADKPPF